MKTKIILLALIIFTAFKSQSQIIACDSNFTFSVNPSGAVTFFANPSGSLAQSFSWSFGNGTSGSGSQVTAFYNAPGSYLVCLTVQDSSLVPPCLGSSCQNVNVTSTGTSCNANFYVYKDTSVGAQPSTYVGVNQSTGVGLTYDWAWGDASPNSVGPYPSHVYAVPGTYNICLTVTGSGCVDTFCLSQIITKKERVMHSITFQAPSGIKEVAKEQANVYPNPADDKIFIPGETNSLYQVEIYNLNGSKVASYSTKGNQSINVASLSMNLYTVKISDANGQSRYSKFMKQ